MTAEKNAKRARDFLLSAFAVIRNEERGWKAVTLFSPRGEARRVIHYLGGLAAVW